MPLPFESVRERLLRYGIAPRHARRYVVELREHLADLTAQERASGLDAKAAAERARILVGTDEQLAQAMIDKGAPRSLAARVPWLVFGILPPFALVLGSLLCVIAMLALGVKSGAIIPDHHNIPYLVPAWYQWTASGMMFAVNFLIVPSLAFLLAWMAQRQRMKLIWPLLGMALILVLSVHGTFHIEPKGRVFLSLGTIIPWKGPLGPGGIDWPTFLAQGALCCLPLAWLWRVRHKTATAQ